MKQSMTVAKNNKRLLVTLNTQRQQNLTRLAKKYHRSQSSLLGIALDMLAEQDQAGFILPKLT